MDKIQNNAMLLTATITKFSNTRRDNGMADELTVAKKASANVIKVTKTLFASPIIKSLNKAHGQLRNHTLNFNTLPWDDGERLIPVESIEGFETAWVTKTDYIDDLKRELVREYPNMLKRAAKDLGDAFDIGDYPTAEEILDRYSATYALKKLPEAGDLRVNLPADKLQKIKDSIEADVTSRVEAATESVHERVVDTLQALIDGLERHGEKAAGAKRASKFTDNTVEKIEELAAVLPSLNITGDPKLTQAGNALLTKLADLDPAKLRESKTERKAVATTAKSIVDNLTGLWD